MSLGGSCTAQRLIVEHDIVLCRGRERLGAEIWVSPVIWGSLVFVFPKVLSMKLQAPEGFGAIPNAHFYHSCRSFASHESLSSSLVKYGPGRLQLQGLESMKSGAR